MLCCRMQWGKKTSKIVPSLWDCITLPEEDRATAVGNMHKNLVKTARGVLEICSQMRLLQYFATATAGKVNI